ncbi:MAG: class I tRNA ligase family protein, partial [Clostridia bacterium]|nr:class I tRNA ligase family protein [Clostridia bacterium]
RHLIQHTSVDAVRYYLLKEGPLVQDTPYSTENYLTVVNKDLCNMLGNLLSRTTAMAEQNFAGELPCSNVFDKDQDDALLNQLNSLYNQYVKDMDEQDFRHAIEKIMSLIDSANKYIDATEPWNLAKDEDKKERLSTVLYNLTEVLRVSAILLTPMIPSTCEKVLGALGVKEENRHFDKARFIDGRQDRTTKIAPLFPRIKVQEVLKAIQGN